MDLEVVRTLNFSLSQNSLFWEDNNVTDMNVFRFFPPNYAIHIFSQSC